MGMKRCRAAAWILLAAMLAACAALPAFAQEAGADWNLAMVDAAGAFDAGCTGQGVRVAVLDSGVNPHAALGGRLLPGHNYVPGAPDPEDTADGYGHGTQIAGLIAGAGIGTAPGAEIVPLKVTEGKSIRIEAVCAAIYDAVDVYGCRVLNLSMGVAADDAALRDAVDYAEARGAVVVAAVGNSGSGGLYYPAAYETVIGVGAVDRGGAVAPGSQRNASVFLTAPGWQVRSIAAPDAYITASGTSFAAPHVSGAAAVLLGMDGGLTPAEVRGLLARTASDRGDGGYDEAYGFGVLSLGGCAAALRGRLAADGFPDLELGAWYGDGVRYALGRGLMNGFPDGTFRPGADATRAMAVTALWRLEGEPEAEVAYQVFSDAEPAAWYAGALRWAAGAGLVTGFPDGSFRPGEAVTRAQLAAMLYRYEQSKGGGFTGLWAFRPDYTDLSALPDWAYEPVCWLTMKGVLQGTGKGRFDPDGHATRAQLAAVLQRLDTLADQP